MPELKYPPPKKGDKFERLTLVRPIDPEKVTGQWIADCSCGGRSTPMIAALRSGRTKSCGRCASNERAKRELAGDVRPYRREPYTMSKHATNPTGCIKPPPPDEVIEQICQAVELCAESQKQIAARFHVHPDTVRSLWRRRRGDQPYPGRKPGPAKGATHWSKRP